MQLIPLTPLDLALGALALAGLAATTWASALGLARALVIAGGRTAAQLALIGVVLQAVFAHATLAWVALIALLMVFAAGREAAARQQRRFTRGFGFAAGTASMFVAAFTTTLLALLVIIRADPWYAPQYAIPLLGMLLGNKMTGVALALDRLSSGAWRDVAAIETRLALGASAAEAIAEKRRDAARAGMIPMINAMAAAGIISLPGMMTGQILAGAAPWDAVKYQILIMFLIAAGTGFGTLAALALGTRRLFDARTRLRLDRLRQR